MLSVRRRLEFALPGIPVAAAELPSGDLAVACVREGELLVGAFDAGSRGNETRRSDKLLRLAGGPGAVWPRLFVPPTGRDHVVVLHGGALVGMDARAMEPRWRVTLDADVRGRAVADSAGIQVAEPTGVTQFDWEGHELGRWDQPGVVGLGGGPGTCAAVTALGQVWRLQDGEGLRVGLVAACSEAQVAASGDAVWVLDRKGWLQSAGTDERYEIDDARAMTTLPGGVPVVSTPAGVCVVAGRSLRRLADFAACGAVICLPSGVVVSAAGSNLLALDGTRAEMLACPSPQVFAPTPTGAWVLGAHGAAMWIA